MKKFREDLKKHATKIINHEKKEMILTKEEKKIHHRKKKLYVKKIALMITIKSKVKDHCHYTGNYRGAAHDICNLRYKMPKEIPVVFRNSSTYDYHFIIKELAEKFEGQFECLRENTEKYITFSVPFEKRNLTMVN